MEAEPIDISIVVPLYNEEASIKLLHKAIDEVMSGFGSAYEIIFVDDGSKDRTVPLGKELVEQHPELRLIEFRKNYGQTPAMAAGIDHARGDILVTMDGDLQNDPIDIPMMVEKLREGYDIVVGWRHNRQDTLVKRKIPSMIANKLISWVTKVPIKDNGCSLKVYRADVMKKTPFYSEMHRFIPALLSLGGAKVAEVKVNHHARQFGESKYGLSRVYKVLLDLIMIKTILSLANHPVGWFSTLAVGPFLIAFLCLFPFFQLAFSGESIVIISSLLLLFFSLGTFLVSLGMLSELIYQKGRIKINRLALLTAELK